RVLVRFDHVARIIVNANHSIMCPAEKLGVADCVAGCVWLTIPKSPEWQCFGKVALCWSASATMPQFAAKADRTPARNSSPHSGLMKKTAAPPHTAFQPKSRH